MIRPVNAAMRKITGSLIALLLIATAGALYALASARQGASYKIRLANGSTFELKKLILSSTNFSYNYERRGPFWDFVAPLVPSSLRSKLPLKSGGGFGFGTVDGETNLLAITVFQHAAGGGGPWPNRLRISDGTTTFDACLGAHTLGMPDETVNGWQVRAFPRRGKTLSLEFLTSEGPGKWETTATFNVPNPIFNEWPQWRPGPDTATNGSLVMQIKEFASGLTDNTPADRAKTAMGKTRMRVTIADGGRPTDEWRVVKLVLSDATGNHWFPYLDLLRQGSSWAKGGEVEFFGALWPGEDAWKLQVEAVQTAGIGAHDLYTLDVPLPAAASIAALTNVWHHGDIAVHFEGLASPGTDHLGNAKWTGKWWGQNADKVYSLVVAITPERRNSRLQLLTAVTESGEPVALLEHRGMDYSNQAFFLQPDTDANRIRLTFSLTEGRWFEFFARPTFMTATNEMPLSASR